MNILKKCRTSFVAQKTRCNNPNATQYKYYGAKGIKVEYSFEEFKEWYLKEIEKFSGCLPTVGRIDHNKNYTLSNIELISQAENSKERHKRNGPTKPKVRVVGKNTITKKTRVFNSINEAHWMTGLTASTVERHINGIRPATGGRAPYYHFERL